MSEAVETYETVVLPKPELVEKVGWVYKWIHKDRPEIVLYVGSTSQTLHQRYTAHKAQLKYKPSPLHIWINEQSCWNDMQMIPIAKVMFYIISQLKEQEYKFQELMQPKFGLRAVVPADVKRIRHRDGMRRHRERSRERINKLERKWYHKVKHKRRINCPCGAIIHPAGPKDIIIHGKTIRHQTFVRANPGVKVPTVEDYKEWRVKPSAES